MKRLNDVLRGCSWPRFHLLAAVVLAGLAPLVSSAADSPRPKVGVVLGGGGALGIAHVGVLRELERMHIPIDYIGGTSMGAIVAGLYANGMSPDEIEKMLTDVDWWDILKDATPRRELDFRRKKDDQRYFIELGWRDGGVRDARGMASGQKFNNLLQYVTLRSASITNFDLLPIPFRCVATDLATGTGLVLDHGNLATAMRASMAVPGAFTPVELDGRVLVDGGIVNNMPVDVVRGLGADVIIAVDVGGSSADAARTVSFQSMGEILNRTYNIMQRPDQEAQMKRADLVIVPDLTGFTAGTFELAAKIVPRGEVAARAMESSLKKFSSDDATFAAFLTRQRRTTPVSLPVDDIQITGNKRVSDRLMAARVELRPGEPLQLQQVRADLLRLHGLGEFEEVLFRYHPAAGSNVVEYAATEKAWGPDYLHLGLRLKSNFDQDSEWGLLMNYRKMSINPLGAEWDSEAQIGNQLRLSTEYYQPLDYRGYLFVAPAAEFSKQIQNVYENEHRVAEYEIQRTDLHADLGVQLHKYAELRFGPVWRDVHAEVATGSTDLPTFDESAGGWSVRLTDDRRDRTVFPREGSYLSAEALFMREEMGAEASYEKVAVGGACYRSMGEHTVALSVRGGTDCSSDLPAYDQFLLGGVGGFMGLADAQFRGDALGIGSLGYNYRLTRLSPSLGRGLYFLTRLDVGNVWADSQDAGTDDVRYGVGGGLGADLAIGPLYLVYGRADGGYSQFYFSLGTAF